MGQPYASLQAVQAPGYDTYLFDLDGTLLDTVELILASHRHTREIHFGDALPDAHYIASMGRTLLDTYTEMAAPRGDVQAMVATYRAFNHMHHDRMTSVYPGVPEMLEQLARRNARLAIVTSKAQALARRGLRVAGVDRFFEVIIGGDTVERGKPDPLPVQRALEVLGADTARAIMVGDSTHDMLAGRRAGVHTAAALWGPFERTVLAPTYPDHWLSLPGDLLAL